MRFSPRSLKQARQRTDYDSEWNLRVMKPEFEYSEEFLKKLFEYGKMWRMPSKERRKYQEKIKLREWV